MYFNHPSQGNSTNYYVILGHRDKAAPPISQHVFFFNPSEASEVPSDTVVHFYFLFLPHPQESSAVDEVKNKKSIYIVCRHVFTLQMHVSMWSRVYK